MVNVTFAVIAAILVVAVLAAVLWPLRHTAPKLMLSMVAVLAVAGFAMYAITGTPKALRPQPAQAEASAPQSLDEAIARLRQSLKDNPAQPEGWLLLGQALLSQQHQDEAAKAFEQVLRLQPEHQRARWLLGVIQREAGDAGKAAETWQPLLLLVNGKTRDSLLEQINLARSEAGQTALSMPATATENGIQIQVSLDPTLAARARLRGDASVFVIARDPEMPGMPVAVQKHTLSELPLSITLGDNDSPMPTRKLSSLKQVQLLARISETGDAMAQQNDLQTDPVTVQLPAKAAVELVLGKP